MRRIYSKLKTFIFPLIIFFTLISLSILGSNYSQIFVNRLTETKLMKETSDFKNLITGRLNLYISVLQSIRGFYLSSNSVERTEFSTFIKTTKVLENYPGIFSTSYIQRVKTQDKESFINSVRNDRSASPSGYPGFRIFPDRIDSEYYVVKYIEPFGGREKTFGFDYRSDPIRRALAEKARDTGELQISQTLTSINTGQKVFIVLVPLYKKNSSISSVVERRLNLEGFVYSSIEINQLFNNLLTNNEDLGKVDWELYEKPNLLIYDSNPKKSLLVSQNDISIKKSEFKIYNSEWMLYLKDPSGGLSFADKEIPTIITMVGMIISTLIFIVIISFSTANARAKKIAEKMTQAYRENEDKFQAISGATEDAIVIMNNKDEISYWNKAAERMFGYSKEEVVGKQLHPLITFDVDYGKYESDISHFQKTGESFVIGRPLSMVVKRKDGTRFTVEITISSIKIEDNWHAVGILRDITQRSKTEEEKKQHTRELERMNKLMVDRELKMIELKEKIKKLEKNA